MNRIIILTALLLCLFSLCGCSSGQIDAGALIQQVETMAAQIDVESILSDVISRIDWEELKGYAQKGYDALTEKYPALKGENIKAFLKENGLELMNKYLQSADEAKQENARKLGEIIKILNPELTDEVDGVLAK